LIPARFRRDHRSSWTLLPGVQPASLQRPATSVIFIAVRLWPTSVGKYGRWIRSRIPGCFISITFNVRHDYDEVYVGLVVKIGRARSSKDSIVFEPETAMVPRLTAERGMPVHRIDPPYPRPNGVLVNKMSGVTSMRIGLISTSLQAYV